MTDSVLALVTQYSFWVGFSVMVAGAVYFAVERQDLVVEYRSIASLSLMVAVIAAINYWYMKDIIGANAVSVDEIAQLPTHFRYIDWLLTTPLILATVPLLAGLGGETSRIMVQLIVADLIMIGAGFVGEVSINANLGATILGWIGFVVAVFAFAFIVMTLLATLNTAIARADAARARGMNQLRWLIVIGWLVYPLGFVITLAFDGASAAAMREFLYNVADVITKVGFGMIAVSAAKKASYVPRDQAL